MNKFVKLAINLLKSNDLYAKTITLTYKGNKSFKTVLGGVLSFIIFMIILVMLIIYAVKVFSYGNTQVYTKTLIKELMNDSTKHYIGKNGFAFAMTYIDTLTGVLNDNKLDDPSYFVVKLQQATYTRVNGTYVRTGNDIPLSKCNDTFPYDDKEVYDKLGLANYLCPESTDYYIQSEFNSDLYYDLEFYVYK